MCLYLDQTVAEVLGIDLGFVSMTTLDTCLPKPEWMSACLNKELQFGNPEHEKSNIIFLSGGDSVEKGKYFSTG